MFCVAFKSQIFAMALLSASATTPAVACSASAHPTSAAAVHLTFGATVERIGELIEELATAVRQRHELSFVAERNAEITASLAAYAKAGAIRFIEARNAEIAASMANYEATRDARFAEARNAEITASLAAYDKARSVAAWTKATDVTVASLDAIGRTETALDFTAARNAEINASIAATNLARADRIMAGRAEKAVAALTNWAAKSDVAFVAARNVEIAASLAAVDAAREARFAADLNGGLETSIETSSVDKAAAKY
ncbi:MAG: hypothetical protein NW216_01610 [Hyphomicrobium sp.]|nr:hypothetical protein [Hyphomicrobium sp.]